MRFHEFHELEHEGFSVVQKGSGVKLSKNFLLRDALVRSR